MSKNFQKWCISFLIFQFYILVDIHENSNKNTKFRYRCMKNCIIMWMKTCFHSHFYVIFHEFLWWAIKATNMFTLLISYMVLFHFKWWSSSFRLYEIFPILTDQMLISPNSSGSDFRKVPDIASYLRKGLPLHVINRVDLLYRHLRGIAPANILGSDLMSLSFSDRRPTPLAPTKTSDFLWNGGILATSSYSTKSAVSQSWRK